jgi:Holliday junction resolvase RusA-like endonuclease
LLPNCHRYPKKKDIDNLVKFLLDAMNKVVYHDDSAITKLIAEKLFVAEHNRDGGAYAEITITELP